MKSQRTLLVCTTRWGSYCLRQEFESKTQAVKVGRQMVEDGYAHQYRVYPIRTFERTATKKTTRRPAAKRTLGATANRPPRVKTMTVAEGKRWGISKYPNFSVTGSIIGMRKRYGRYALLVRCGSYIYNVQGNPEIYDAAH